MKNGPGWKLDSEKCIRCGACIGDCPVQVLRRDDAGYPVMSRDLLPACIQCQHCFAICPNCAISMKHADPEKAYTSDLLPDPDALSSLLKMRRSVRQYKMEPVSVEDMAKVKEILRYFPTGCNDHQMIFRIVEKAEEMAQFRKVTMNLLSLLVRSKLLHIFYPGIKRFLEEIRNGKDVIYRDAPHMIVAASPKNAPCKHADPWIALSYLDTYLQSMKIGTCWCGFALYAFLFSRKLRKLLALPKGYKAEAVLLFGYPAVKYARAAEPEDVKIID